MVLLDLELPPEFAELAELVPLLKRLPPDRRARLFAYLLRELAEDGSGVLHARDVSRYVVRRAACRGTKAHAVDLAGGGACRNCGLSRSGLVSLPPRGEESAARAFVLPGDQDVDPVPLLAPFRDS